VDGFVGLIFRREPAVKLPEHTAGVAGALRVFAEDVDLMGTALFTYCKSVVLKLVDGLWLMADGQRGVGDHQPSTLNHQPAVGFLEFTGQGLTTFERAMDRDERLMAVLGSRMLEEHRRVGEAAQAIELRQSAEHGVLMTLALSVSDSISQVLRWVYWWNSTEESPEVIGEDLVLLELNTDFSVKGMEAKDLTAIVAAWQKGAISRETMFDLFRRGEVLPVGRTDEEEARLTRNAEREVMG
jgi:hypothetical protein